MALCAGSAALEGSGDFSAALLAPQTRSRWAMTSDHLVFLGTYTHDQYKLVNTAGTPSTRDFNGWNVRAGYNQVYAKSPTFMWAWDVSLGYGLVNNAAFLTPVSLQKAPASGVVECAAVY